MKKLFNKIFIVLFIFIFNCTLVYAIEETDLTITALDIKVLGDCVILQSGGKTLIIDAGTSDDNNTLIKYFEANNIKKFDFLLTHYHSDHWGEFPDLITKYKGNIENVYLRKITYITKYVTDEYNKTSSIVSGSSITKVDVYNKMKSYKTSYNNVFGNLNTNTKLNYLNVGDIIELGSNTKIYVIAMPDITFESLVSKNKSATFDYISNSYMNNSSVVLLIKHGDNFTYFSGGDIEVESEDLLLEEVKKGNVSIKADLMKLSHHALDTSNQLKFMQEVNPRYLFYMYHKSSDDSIENASNFANYSRLTENVHNASSIGNVYSTGYNGNLTFRITKEGDITVEPTRNYLSYDVNYYNKSNTKIKDSITYKVNNAKYNYPWGGSKIKLEQHLFEKDYIKTINGYTYSNFDVDDTNHVINVVYEGEHVFGLSKLVKDDVNKILENITVNTKVKDLYSTTTNNDDLEIYTSKNVLIYSKDIVDDSTLLSTGQYVTFYSGGNKLKYIISVLGDTNGDSKINSLDYVKIKNHIMETKEIEGQEYLSAADYNTDKKISSLDYVKIRNYIMSN